MGIINGILLERVLGMVTSDDPYADVVAKILRLSLFLFVLCQAPFLFAVPSHDKGSC
jgi:hypothetical protein